MKVIMKNRSGYEEYKAFGEYKNGKITVLKDSKIRNSIAKSNTFKLSNVANKYREDENYVKNNIVIKDIVFDSPTAAAQFVCGHSISGILSWRSENGKTLKEILKEK